MAEVTVINKQTFLNELSGLLTFMTEEDRLEALTLYEKMFDDTDDEQELIQALRSPTRQAVVIARAYDANARKARAASPVGKSREDEEPEETPDFVMAILRVYEECVPLPEEPAYIPAESAAPEVLPNQVSLFDAAAAEPEEPEDYPVIDEPDAAAAEESFVLPEDAAEEPVSEEDAFRFEPPLEADEASGAEEDEAEAPAPKRREPPLLSEAAERGSAPVSSGETVRRPRVLLLILFILAAVPLTLLGVALLLIPTLLSLLLACAAIAAGGAGIATAFSGAFPVLADILLALGCSVILLALGVLFLWLFVWFIGGAIGGLIRSVVQLGKSWCYEEVPA